MKDLVSTAAAESMECSAWLYEHYAEQIANCGALAADSLARNGRLCFACCELSVEMVNLSIDNLMQRKTTLRPPLPAFRVSGTVASRTESIDAAALEGLFNQIDGLCQAEDCVVIVLDNCKPEILTSLNTFAEQKPFNVIGLVQLSEPHSDSAASPAARASGYQSLPLFLPSIARKQESTLFILNCLGAMIENSLFGTVL